MNRNRDHRPVFCKRQQRAIYYLTFWNHLSRLITLDSRSSAAISSLFSSATLLFVFIVVWIVSPTKGIKSDTVASLLRYFTRQRLHLLRSDFLEQHSNGKEQMCNQLSITLYYRYSNRTNHRKVHVVKPLYIPIWMLESECSLKHMNNNICKRPHT